MGVFEHAVSPLAITRLPGTGGFGVHVDGLKEEHLTDPDIRRQLYDLWIDEGLIVFGNVHGRKMLVSLSAVFGKLVPGVIREISVDDDPFVTSIRYNPETGWMMEVDGRRTGAWQYWHVDGIYGKSPNRGGIMMPVVLPSKEGKTGFIDLIRTYDELPEDLKREIHGLKVVYKLDPINNYERPRLGQTSIRTIQHDARVVAVTRRLDDYPAVTHPLVSIQRETGKKVLIFCPTSCVSIEGMDKERSDALLRRLIAHCTDEKRAYYHAYQPGDMVLWDNWRVLHRSGGTAPDEERVMERTTIDMEDAELDQMAA